MLTLTQVSLGQRVKDIDLRCEGGQFIHLLGPNGAGKSTLLSLIAGLERPECGYVYINDVQSETLSNEFLASFRCFQQQQHSTPFALSVSEVLAFFGHAAALPDDILAALDIGALLHRPFHRLSGGEQRRVQIARSLMQVWPAITSGTALILLDEPIQGLDFKHQHTLFALLSELAENGNLVVCSHHDLNLAYRYASMVCLLKEGKLVMSGKPDVVMHGDNLSQIFDCRTQVITTEQNQLIFQTYLD